MSIKKVKIRDIFHFEKGTLQSSKNNPGEYNFITAGKDWKTHDAFSHECEALVFAMAASGSLGRTHYVNGKFIASDLCFILTPKNPKLVNMQFYHIYFNMIRKDIVAKTATGSAKLAINQKNFGNYEIVFGDIDDQNRIFERINTLSPNIEKFISIFDGDDLVQKLRQSILQDAIQGKLVPQDPNDEPASELLKRIQHEKEQLIKEKKIKKPKELATITDDEKPFVLPSGWVWVRLGEISNYGSCQKLEPKDAKNGLRILDLEDIEKDSSKILKKIYYPEREFSSTKSKFLKGQLLYSKLRPYLNKVVIADEDGVCTTEILPIKLYGEINQYFIKIVLKSNYFLEYVNKITYGIKMPRLGTEDGQVALLPLPPLAEQQRIVAKVDELMKFCDGLEKEISEAKENGEKLMESVLGEVFR